MRASTSPFFTTAPSRTAISATVPLTLDFTTARSSASTVALAYAASIAFPRTMGAVATGTRRSANADAPARAAATGTRMNTSVRRFMGATGSLEQESAARNRESEAAPG